MPSNRKRRSRKESYWRKQVAKWRTSGLSQAEFSRQVGFSSRAFGYWKRRLDHEDLETPSALSIVAVPIAQPAVPPIPHRPIIIHAGRGFTLKIPDDFHPGALEKILLVLGRLT